MILHSAIEVFGTNDISSGDYDDTTQCYIQLMELYIACNFSNRFKHLNIKVVWNKLQ